MAPEFSPITPRAQPVFPATYPPPPQSASEAGFNIDRNVHSSQFQDSIAPTAQYIPQPAPQPFSSQDATDAIALRAAISSLQFQKKKAQDDIKALEKIKKRALDDPGLFKSELASGRLNEQRPKVGDLQAILDQADSDDEEEDAVLGALDEGDSGRLNSLQHVVPTSEAKDSESLQPASSSSAQPNTLKNDDSAPFGHIPGPQNVVRMPYVNWDKYHVSGEPFDSMHEQQRRWPGSTAYGQDRGREQAVAAPYSPWLDSLDGQQRWEMDRRNDSVTTPTTAVTPTVSEHPMETRRSKMSQ